MELDRESTAEEGEVVLWRANFEEFMRRLRHKVGTLFSLSLCPAQMYNVLHLAMSYSICSSFISSDESNCSFSFLSSNFSQCSMGFYLIPFIYI